MYLSPNRTANVIRRQELEIEIIDAVVSRALALGFKLGVNDGGGADVLENCGDTKKIWDALYNTDEDMLIVYRNGIRVGWVRFVYGNDGWDVINDYTTNLEPIMSDAEKIIRRYS